MNLRDFQYIVAVAEHRNFRKAAEYCNVSQPTLSMQIKKLEEYLQVKFFERSNNKIIITEAGYSIIEKARNIASLVDDIKTISKTYQNPFSGTIKVGAFPTLAPYYFPKFLNFIKGNFDDIKTFLIEEKTETLIEMLKLGEIDLCLLALPLPSEESILNTQKIFSEDFYLAVSKDNNFASQDIISMDDIKNEKLLLLEDGHCLRDQALEVCKLSGAEENKDFRATSLETLRYMVAEGLGITFIPEIAKRKDDNIKYIKIKDENNKTIKREIALAWRKESPRTKLFQEICDKLING